MLADVPDGLERVNAGALTVWRVGRAPDPWAWVEHQYSGHNRWDDAGGEFRTVYAAESLYACYVEVLAYARPDIDADGQDLLAGIHEDSADALAYPVPAAGTIPPEWIGARMAISATLSGSFVDVRAASTIATLRPLFLLRASQLGFPDVDAAALKSAHPRDLTQGIASYLYTLTDDDGEPTVDGIRFASRHGDELILWAVFERPGDEPASRLIERHAARLVEPNDPDLLGAMSLHGLTWLHAS